MRTIVSFFAFYFCWACSSVPSPPQADVDATFHQPRAVFTVLNVHQGDATLIRSPEGHFILMDAGNYHEGAQALREQLFELGVHTLDAVFITHYDADHFAGLIELREGLDGLPDTDDDILIHRVYDRGTAAIDSSGYLYSLYAHEYQDIRSSLHAGHTWDFGSLQIHCLLVNGLAGDGESFFLDPATENTRGAVLLVRFGDFLFLNMGDLPAASIEGSAIPDLEMKIASLAGPVQALHVGHHGSASSTSSEFLKAVRPEIALLSVGNENPYHHPAPSVLHRLLQAQIPIYQTERGETSPHILGVHILEGPLSLLASPEGDFELTDF